MVAPSATLRSVLTWVAVKSSTFPVLAVTRPFIVAVATVFKSAFVITLVAMVVAFPDEIISPVKLALVTTVVALPTLVTIPVKLALVAEVIPVRPVPLPANPVAVKIPVEGTKLIFVEDTF